MRSINPATGQVIREFPDDDEARIAQILERAGLAFPRWSARPVSERAAALRGVARVLRAGLADHARLMTTEMGKTIASAEAEVEKCALTADWVADHAPVLLAPEPAPTEARASYVRFDPLGVVLAVMPWNFPFWQVFRCALPALAAGNTVVLKHASNVPGCALAIEQVFRDAGLPEGAFSTLLVPSAALGPIVDHPAVRGVSLTGSEPAGRDLARRAGAALKKTVLELGGSDAFLVLADADIDEVAGQAAAARVINNGQSCIAAKRFIVVEPVADRFESAFVERMRALRVGDPLDRSVQVGPLARPDLVDELEDQVRRTVEAGATLRLGGSRLAGPGCYFPPTVLTGVEPGMAAFDEETFGPVAPVTRARDAAHALELANRSRYGLGVSLWTGNATRARELAARCEAGAVFVNAAVKSDPRVPFGGVKCSGYGRELAAFGLREFVNVKTVWVA
ncbi:MAG TPA: NAD-dependent succinate-semialdehyde dehydrogenase [Terriglobales bacterium]|nr:NAD-dependent succinate-semialdehyde dehydrogenase [Terriglobales bacterium]